MAQEPESERRAAPVQRPAEPAPSRIPVVTGPALWSEDEVEEVSLLQLANVLLKWWKLVAGLPLAAAFLAVVISLVIPSKYTGTATFVPETESKGISLPGGLMGLASQFGVTVPSGGTSARFYADVLESRTLRDEVLLASFQDPRTRALADSATLLDILEIDGDTEVERLETGRKELDATTSAWVDNETSVVSVSVETRYPRLSADVANLYLRLLNRFNLETRQSQARERRRFIEERLAAAEQELRAGEEVLQTFLERNRQFRGSPELEVEYERLQRQVRIKEQVFTTLRQQYEEARIQEVNDTPVITVIDEAVPPDEKSSPKHLLNITLAFVLGGILAVLVAFAREYVQRIRERDEEAAQQFRSHWEAMKREIRSAVPHGRSPAG